jgi:hypothetical protein
MMREEFDARTAEIDDGFEAIDFSGDLEHLDGEAAGQALRAKLFGIDR